MKASKVAQYGLIAALALVLSYLESLVPSLGVPGVKLGLPNIAIVFALYRLGWRDACIISLVRVFLVFLLFGNGAGLAYSLAGAALSLSLMGLLKKTGRFSSVGVSVAGGVAHNAGQILVAMALLETARLAWYLPVLWISGTVAGVLIGIVSGVLVERVPDQR
ncbi:MAG: Gx transporter family protein [Oscillospiraceae bacterium]|jgi:heptaprenyl diphosphate synthase|nr:Gx transporter family protein [Oscillospiraceae bacterium]